MVKHTIYDEFVDKYVRLITSNDAFLGYLKEISIDRAVLEPSLISQSTALGAKFEIGGKTILDYRVIICAQEVEESYLNQICEDAKLKFEQEKLKSGQKDNLIRNINHAVPAVSDFEKK